MNKSLHLLLLALGCLVAGAAVAEWQWLDKDGRKVFSDRAPGPEIPDKSILKRPGGKVGAPATAALPAASAASAPKPPTKDTQLEAKKKQAEEEEQAKEKAKQKELEDKNAKAMAANCERAKRSAATFKSGVRISQPNAKGEFEVMDDATRAAEAKRIDGIIASDCK